MALTQGLTLLFIFTVLTVFGLYAIFQKKTSTALLLILSLAFALRIFMAGDLYLHDWDERFHANVAKNVIHHPLVPVLYDDDVLEYEPNNWAEGTVWLSKPVLAFWPIGLSISTFGANEFGLRFPSLLFGLLSVWLTFLIGRRLFDDRVGLIGAFLHAVHGMLLRFGGGITSSDHVDQLFTLLFACGIYSYIIYFNCRKKRYLILVGIIAGLAFLTKWVMALFLVLIIAVLHLFVVERFSNYVRDGILVLSAMVVIAAPWIIYLFVHQPIEIKLVFGDFLTRTDEVFEGHSGGPLFYLEQIISQFRAATLVPLLWLIMVAWRKRSQSQLLLAVWIFLPILLLSLLTTKRGTYLLMSAPAYFLLTGYFLRWFMLRFRSSKKHWVITGVYILLLGLPVHYTIEQVKPFERRFYLPEWRIEMRRQITWFERLGEKVVLSGHPHAMDAMFYYDVLAYERKLNPEEVKALEAEGYMIISPLNDQ